MQNPFYERDINTYSKEERIKKEFFALKKISNKFEPDKGLDVSSLRELSLLKDMRHENIIR